MLDRSRSDGELAAVNRCLLSHGLDVYELHVARTELEAIFMKLIEARIVMSKRGLAAPDAMVSANARGAEQAGGDEEQP